MTYATMKPDLAGSNLTGVFWAFLGVGLFGFIYISGRLSGGDISAGQLIWFRYVGALIGMTLWITIFPSERAKVRSRQVPVHGLRAMAGGGGGMAAIYAASHMSVTSATAIGLLDGLFVIILGVVLLGERFSAKQWAAAALCLLGAAVVVLASGAATVRLEDMLPASAALLGAFLVATESIMIKKLARSETSVSVLFYVSLFGTVLFSVPAAASWNSLGPAAIGLLLLLGPIALAGQLCNIFAFRRSDAALIGPIRYTWIIWGALFGWLFFGEIPLAATWGGMVLILCGGCYLAFSRNRKPMQ
ncbi:DMT family transporter [Salipiger aestuarii]|uniref:DMT family transporter n=1 Tax=Salipiger aestuarii TaxID=568098 RepID=UPI00123AAE9C|nr:DMT family transporter [Salipiger aestuarii]